MPFERNSLLDMMICFGRLPDAWLSKWNERAEYCTDDGQLKMDEVPHRRGDLVLRVYGSRQRMVKEEYDWFWGIMSGIFKLDPKERMEAGEVLRCLPPHWSLN
jgi:hypothetical protein